MTAREILFQVAELVSGDRRKTHGDAAETQAKVGALWTVFLGGRKLPDAPLSGVEVAQMMCLLKIARTQSGEFNMDDFLDAIGYSAIAAENAKSENLLCHRVKK